jgi:hypothetical protein
MSIKKKEKTVSGPVDVGIQGTGSYNIHRPDSSQ